MNSGKQDAAINLIFHDRTLRLVLPAVSITTATWGDAGT
jgi:hypothetical protein